MAKTPEQAQAIEDFVQAADLEEKLARACTAVAARNPTAVMIFWEEDDGYGVATIPHSRALAQGLALKLCELVLEEEDEDDDGMDVDEGDGG